MSLRRYYFKMLALVIKGLNGGIAVYEDWEGTLRG